MSVRVREHLGDLIADLEEIGKTGPTELRGVVKDGVRVGNSVAKDFARLSARRHGKHYPNAFTWEMRPTFSGYGANVYQGEYGPDISRPQGGMRFENGSRNQPPHNDLAKSADLIGPSFAQEVGQAVDRLFW